MTTSYPSVRDDASMANKYTLAQLLKVSLPTSEAKVNDFTLNLTALPAKALDDLITKYPPEKDSDAPFNSDLRYELISLTVTNAALSIDDVKQIYETWSRPQISVLQGAVFDINWAGVKSEELPLSETESEETEDTPLS